MFAWRCVGVVPVVSVWQIACRVQRLYVVHLHRLLSASRLSTEARRILHAFADDTQLYLHGASCCSAGTMHHRRRPLDVCQPSQAEHGDKTELLWVGSRQSFPARLLSSSSTTRFRLHIVARDHVRLLGVTLSSDLSFDRHVSIVSASSIYWLRQLQRSRRSLDMESAATLVHLFVASHIDYCNAILAGASKPTTNKLQRMLIERRSSCSQRYP